MRLEAKRLQDEVERLSLEVVALKDNDIKKDLKLSTLTRQLEKHQESTKQVQTMRDQVLVNITGIFFFFLRLLSLSRSTSCKMRPSDCESLRQCMAS